MKLIIAIALLALPVIVYAGGGLEVQTYDAGLSQSNGSSYTPSYTSPAPIPSYAPTGSDRYTVQRVNTYKYWRQGDEIAIDCYLRRQRLNMENYQTIKIGLPQLVGSGQIDARDCNGRLILNQKPVHYITMIQSYYGVTAGTDWYVNVPRLPEFRCGGSQGKLVLEPEVKCRPQTAAGALVIYSSGDYRESDIGWYSQSRTKERQRKQETCDPLPPGDPRVPVPPPPSSGAVIGSFKPINEVGGFTSNPLPSHRRVADPVN